MHCPFCDTSDTKVIDSRLVSEGSQVRRRRECLGCNERFTTFELAELLMPKIIKRDGLRVPFDENKLRAGLERALEKRPIDCERLETAITHIIRALRTIGDREVSSLKLGEIVMTELKGIDQVAYVRFASVYRRFQDIADFSDALAGLKERQIT